MTILFHTNRLEGLDFYQAKGRTEFRRAVCETRGSHRAVAGRLGKRLAGKSAMQRAVQSANGGLTWSGGGRVWLRQNVGAVNFRKVRAGKKT